VKKIILGFICVLGFGMAEVAVHTQVSLEETLEIQANKINRTLPKMLNDKYRYEEVKVEKSSLVNRFTLLNVHTNDIDIKYFITLMEADLKEDLCENSDLKEMFQLGLRLKCVFVEKDHERVIEFIYDTKDCTLKRDKLEWNGYFNFS